MHEYNFIKKRSILTNLPKFVTRIKMSLYGINDLFLKQSRVYDYTSSTYSMFGLTSTVAW